MGARIFGKIGARQLEQRSGGTQPLFLQVDKRAGKLNQAFVKISIRAMPIRQPKFFQNIVRFVELLSVEAIEVAEIVCAEFATLKGRDALSDFSAFFTHAQILAVTPRPAEANSDAAGTASFGVAPPGGPGEDMPRAM